MSTETPMVYSDDILRLVDMYSEAALRVQTVIGGSSIAALGAILEEYNDRRETTVDALSQSFADYWSNSQNNNHSEIFASYTFIAGQGVSWRADLSGADKLLYPVMIDVGPGNIQLYTAITLLNEYNARYPASDPLGLKGFNTDYRSLALSLSDSLNNTTVKFASLMVDKGLRWGQQNVTNWATLDPLEQQAFAVYFYNVGEDFVTARRNAAIGSTGSYNVDIDNTDIAQEYLLNYARILERMLPGNENLSGLRELIADGELNIERCFLAGTTILLLDGTHQLVETMQPGDWVQSYDAAGNLVPGRVRRVIRNRVRHVLDVFGLMVTPGHVTLCGDGPFAGQHVPILDILRSDGALVRADGSFVRAATGVPLGHADDGFVWAVTGQSTAEGFVVNEARALRRGTRVLTASGHDFSLAELIAANGGTITDDGLVLGSSGQGAPFVWTLSSRLPGPEDYVLARSAVTLEDIFHADEWEDQRPSMPAPRGLQPSDEKPEPNMPIALRTERVSGQQGPRSFAAAVSRPGERLQ